MGKDPIKHADTLVSNVGNATVPQPFLVIDVQGRNIDGGLQAFRNFVDNKNLCVAGDVVKYVNFCIEAVARELPMENDDASQNNAWLEWALVMTKEATQTVIPNTNTGTRTLGDIAIAMFRGDCLITGCIPVGAYQPIVQDLKIKLPNNKVKMQVGTNLTLWTKLRTISAADVRTDSHRLVLSTIYKSYS